MIKYQSLLYEVQPSEVEYMLREYQLRQQGYTIVYLNDPDELRRYCFPFGLDDQEKNKITEKKTEAYIADEQLLLHAIYSETEDRHIVPIEYFDELRGMIRYSTGQADKIPLSGAAAFDYFFKNNEEELQKLLSADSDEQLEVTREFVEGHFAEAYASATMLLKGIEKLSKVLKHHLILEDDKADAPEEVLDALAYDINEEELEEERLMEYLDDIVDNKNLTERPSKRRDIRIIRKLMAANHYCAQKGYKIQFVYFTDAESSTELLDHLFENGPAVFRPFSDFPICRKRRQLFVKLLCESSGDIDDNYQQMIKATKHYVGLINSSKFENEEDYLFEIGKIKDYYREIRNKFENENIFRHYVSEMEDALALARQHTQAGQIVEVLSKIFESKDEIVQHLSAFSGRLFEMTIESHFSAAVIAVHRNETLVPVPTKGKDKITGKFHHLPILFQLDPKFSHYLQVIVRIITEEQHTSELLNVLKEKITLLSEEDGTDYQVKLLKTLVCLIVQPYSTHTVNEDLYRLSNYVMKEIRQEEYPSLLVYEFIYLAVWMSRRAEKYKESLKLCNEVIEDRKTIKVPYIARFYHGRFMAKYCLFLSSDKKENPKEQLKSAVEDILIALQGYESCPDPGIRSKLRQSLLNSITYLCLELHIVTGETTYVVRAREYLTQLKMEAGKNYTRPEYFHTESMLEYYESFHADSPQRKIDHALEAIEKALLYPFIHLQSGRKYKEHRDLLLQRKNLFNGHSGSAIT